MSSRKANKDVHPKGEQELAVIEGEEILGQPELTPYQLTNKEAELTGTISRLSENAKKRQFYSTLGEFWRAYRGHRFVRARKFRIASPTVPWGFTRSRMLHEAITYSN